MGDSPAVHMWQEEWGAHAIPLTGALWLHSRETGTLGTLTSRIITWGIGREGERNKDLDDSEFQEVFICVH